jgi:hypothetical protein
VYQFVLNPVEQWPRILWNGTQAHNALSGRVAILLPSQQLLSYWPSLLFKFSFQWCKFHICMLFSFCWISIWNSSCCVCSLCCGDVGCTARQSSSYCRPLAGSPRHTENTLLFHLHNLLKKCIVRSSAMHEVVLLFLEPLCIIILVIAIGSSKLAVLKILL